MNIACVVVTYNRLEKLKRTLQSYEEQTDRHFSLIVIDNHSTDGSIEYLKKWAVIDSSFGKTVIYLNENVGGAGGFCEGMKHAVQKTNADWVMLADDDAYPDSHLIENLRERINQVSDDVGCISTKVSYPDGELQLFHRRRIQKNHFTVQEIDCGKDEYNKDFFYANEVSFVGSCFRRSEIEKVGYPNKDFFIWFDDTEYSLRINNIAKLICVPSLVYCHDIARSSAADSINKANPSWKIYYGTRNRLWVLRKYYPKRYFKFAKFENNLRRIKNQFMYPRLSEMLKDANKDATKNILGKNPKYLP